MGYNYIFKKLVKDPDDVSGALAYVLYKNEKVAYIEEFTKDQGHEPTEAELAEFHRMTNLPGRIEAYRTQAEDLLNTFLDNALGAQLLAYKQQVKDEAVLGELKQMKEVQETNNAATIEAIKPSFASGVGQNLIAGLITTFITFGFVLLVWMYNEGPTTIMQNGLKKYLGNEPATSEKK